MWRSFASSCCVDFGTQMRPIWPWKSSCSDTKSPCFGAGSDARGSVPPIVHSRRPEPTTYPRSVQVLRPTRDADAVASRTRPPEVDLPSTSRSACNTDVYSPTQQHPWSMGPCGVRGVGLCGASQLAVCLRSNFEMHEGVAQHPGTFEKPSWPLLFSQERCSH